MKNSMQKPDTDYSESGPGSRLSSTVAIRALLPPLISALGVKSLLDSPCGDLHWMQNITLPSGFSYTGLDLNPERIEINNKLHSQFGRFLVGDIVLDKLPHADAILCRDCLVHLSLEQGVKAIANFKRSGAKYLVATTYLDCLDNVEVPTEGCPWRKTNLELYPYNLGRPQHLILESGTGTEWGFPDYAKSLGVWRINGQ
jgi:hypothetical protein